MMRLFIAWPLPDQVREQLGQLISLCKGKGASVKWVAAENIHLTARFLGDTEETLIPQINRVTDEVAGLSAAVNTEINRLGGFPNLKRPRVIWAGLGADCETLAAIARQVELRVRKLRYKPEKKSFKAHLTLGRVRRPQGLDALTDFLNEYRFVSIPVLFDRLCLFSSTLTPKGPIYKRLHESMLTQDRFGE